MPGTTTEPKSTPWTVAEQFVEERMKLKQSNSRIVLALRNAKIHRPSLYLSAKKSFKRALEQTTLNAAQENSLPINTVKTNKTSTFSGCKLERPGLQEEAKNLSKIASKNSGSELLGKGRQSDEDSNKILSCSCQVALDTKSKNPLRIKANSDTKLSVDKSENTVALKTVNVKPWENDVVKGALKTEQIHNQNTDGNIAHLTFLMQECNAQRSNEISKHGNIGPSCQPDAGNTVQHANQKLLKPESTVYSDDTMSREGNPDCDGSLSGVLLISSKMPPNPCCFHQLRSLDKEQLTTKRHPTETNFAGYTLPPLKRDGNRLCLECQCTVSKVSGQQGSGTQSDVDSKQLKRLKYRLLRECVLLEKEVSETDSKVPALRPKLANILPSDSDVEHQTASTLGESFTLPKLYLPHHSTSTQDGKTRPKNTDSQIVPDICLSSKGQSCHKLIKVERMNNTNLYRNKTSANKKPAKLLKSKEPTTSAKRCERYKPRDADHGGRVSLTQLRGFTPHEFPASPIRWIGNTVLQNDETVKEDLIQEKKKTGKNQRRF